MTQRLVKHPFLALFDGPDTNASTDVRQPFDRPAPGALPPQQPVRAASRRAGFAGRLIAGSTDEPERRIDAGVSNWPGAPARARRELERGDAYPARTARRAPGRRAAMSRAASLEARSLDEPGQGPPDCQRVPLHRLSYVMSKAELRESITDRPPGFLKSIGLSAAAIGGIGPVTRRWRGRPSRMAAACSHPSRPTIRRRPRT